MLPLFGFFIAFIIAAFLVSMMTNIVTNKKLKHDIQLLWSKQKPLENFVRPNHI